MSVVGSVVLLLLLAIFLLQNGQRVDVSYFGTHSHLPLAVAMLLSAVGGALLVAIAGTARILQLRRGAQKGQGSSSVGGAAVVAGSAGRRGGSAA